MDSTAFFMEGLRKAEERRERQREHSAPHPLVSSSASSSLQRSGELESPLPPFQPSPPSPRPPRPQRRPRATGQGWAPPGWAPGFSAATPSGNLRVCPMQGRSRSKSLPSPLATGLCVGVHGLSLRAEEDSMLHRFAFTAPCHPPRLCLTTDPHLRSRDGE